MEKIAPIARANECDCRKRHLGLVFVAIILSIWLCGCVERTVFDTPYLQAHVKDINTGRPIKDVQISVWNESNSKKMAFGVSDDNGRAYVGSLIHKKSTILPWDYGPPNGVARFEAIGYKTIEVRISGGINNVVVVNLAPK